MTVKFSPSVARTFAETCYVELEGLAVRQAVILRGVGLGPHAVFSYDLLDVGNIYVRTLYRYTVILENRGDIPVPFVVDTSSSAFASTFRFNPSAGVVDVDETQSIQVEVMATQLGRFDERIPVSVSGTDLKLMLHFKGRVVGPTYQIDTADLNFGIVAYGFRRVSASSCNGTAIFSPC